MQYAGTAEPCYPIGVRNSTSRRFGIFRRLASGCVLATAGTDACLAADVSGGMARSPAPTVFIDLTAGRSVGPAQDSIDQMSAPETQYFDLTTGANAPPAIAAPVPVPSPSGSPRMRFVDLTTGASPDTFVEPEVETAARADIVTGSDPNDPFEETNRGRFRSHVALHHYVIDPVETTYIDTVPEPLRVGLHNFLTNIETPSVFANDVLQVQPRRATNTLSRFVINSTVGIVGILDVATHIGIRYRDDDFGQTLATYGMGNGPYLLVPVIGPSNPRDLGGKIVDFFLNPLRYFTLPGGFVTSIGHAGAHEIDKRSFDVGELDELSRSAPDPYATERDRARRRRNVELGIYPEQQ